MREYVIYLKTPNGQSNMVESETAVNGKEALNQFHERAGDLLKHFDIVNIKLLK